MKKYVLLTGVALALMMPAVVWGQNAGNTSPTGHPSFNGGAPHNEFGGPQGGGPEGRQEDEAKHFEEHKAAFLKHINEHLAEVLQRKKCVEAATNHQGLRTCFPQMRGEGPQHGEYGHGGPGQGEGGRGGNEGGGFGGPPPQNGQQGGQRP